MKKLSLFLTMAFFALFANAQTYNLTSAIQNLKKGNLDKAKSAIDEACEHESTKNDAKTWCYAGLIYSKIGIESTNDKSIFKDLDSNWREVAFAASNRCKELDKDNAFANQNNEVLQFLGNDFYSHAVKAFNEKNYAESMALSDKAIKVFDNSGDVKLANKAVFLAGLCAKESNDIDKLKKYFGDLASNKYEKEFVYRTLFNIYKDDKNAEEAVNVATSYNNAFPNDCKSYFLLAEAYYFIGDMEKGRDFIERGVALSKDNQDTYSQSLFTAGSIMEKNKDYASAEKMYLESLNANPDQFDANFGIGIMTFNKAVDKMNYANAIPRNSQSGNYTKLIDESNELLGSTIQYFKSAINYIDNLSSAKDKQLQKSNLIECLKTLKIVYEYLNNNEDLKMVNDRLNELQSQQ